LFEKYINMINKDIPITCGQTSQGYWYCKELKAENTEELKNLINEINKILNGYNKKEESKK